MHPSLPSCTYDTEQTLVTSRQIDARHQQTRLLMMAISRWLCVWSAAVRHLPSILRNCWAALMPWVSRSTISYTNACLTHALLAGTDRIHSNSYMNTHRLTRHPLLDKQCRSAIIISMTVICHLKEGRKTPNRGPVRDRVPPCRPPCRNNVSFNQGFR